MWENRSQVNLTKNSILFSKFILITHHINMYRLAKDTFKILCDTGGYKFHRYVFFT